MHELNSMTQLGHQIKLCRQADGFLVSLQEFLQPHRVKALGNSDFWIFLINVILGDVWMIDLKLLQYFISMRNVVIMKIIN
jgi:hypothetical protein